MISCEIANRELGFGDPGGEIGAGRFEVGDGGHVILKAASAVVDSGRAVRLENTGAKGCGVGVERVTGRDIVPGVAATVVTAGGVVDPGKAGAMC